MAVFWNGEGKIGMPILNEDVIDFAKYMQETDAQERVRPASDYLGQVMHIISPSIDQPKNAMLPFKKTFVEFNPGEVTIWAGENGSGKSMLQGQIISLFSEREPCCIASFEMKPARTLARIAKQALRVQNPTKQNVEAYFNKLSETLWLYDQQGDVNPDRLMAVIKYCAEVLNCKHIAIDSLMKCVQNEDDYNGQKRFVNLCTIAAKDYNTHIHIVAHMRKNDQGAEFKRPSKGDIKGTGAITDLADNVLILWRNKKKEREIEANNPVPPDEPDVVLICDKQRNGEWEGTTKLWFNKETFVYSDNYFHE